MYYFWIGLFFIVACSSDGHDSSQKIIQQKDSTKSDNNMVQLKISKKVSDKILNAVIENMYSQYSFISIIPRESSNSFSYVCHSKSDSIILNILRINGDVSISSSIDQTHSVDFDSVLALRVGIIYLQEFFGSMLNKELEFGSILVDRKYWQVGQKKDKKNRDKPKCGGGNPYVNIRKDGGGVIFIGASK